MLMNLINPKKSNKQKAKDIGNHHKLFKSETKENNYKFSRKNSENSERVIDFYATQTLTTKSPDNKENGTFLNSWFM